MLGATAMSCVRSCVLTSRARGRLQTVREEPRGHHWLTGTDHPDHPDSPAAVVSKRRRRMTDEVTSTRVTQRVVDGSTDVARSDLISWSSIVAGVVTAFGLFVLFGAIAVAAGLESTDTPFKLGGAQVGSIIAGLFGVISFLVGGFVAAWTAHVDEGDSAMMHGFLVWGRLVVLLV